MGQEGIGPPQRGVQGCEICFLFGITNVALGNGQITLSVSVFLMRCGELSRVTVWRLFQLEVGQMSGENTTIVLYCIEGASILSQYDHRPEISKVGSLTQGFLQWGITLFSKAAEQLFLQTDQ